MGIMLKTAKQAALVAGKILLDNFKKSIEVKQKGKNDLVTNIDIKAENKVLSMLKKKFPDHCFDSEESGIGGNKDSKYTWLVDALDGTINFARELNPFSVSIGLLKDGKPYLGVIYDPIQNELYYAQKGKGAFMNGKCIKVSSRKKLEESIIVSDLTTKKELHEDFFNIMKKISKSVLGIRITHSTSLNLAHLSCGRYDIFIKNKISYIDIIAGGVIIEEAGGKLTDFDNKKIKEGMKNIVATNKLLHKQVLKQIS